jgi:hypothetical protein
MDHTSILVYLSNPSEPKMPLYIETSSTCDQPYQRPSRQRTARLTSAQIREAIDAHNVDLLNAIAVQRKLPGYEFTKISVDNHGKGLCLRASQFIAATPAQSKTGLCEYGGTERLVDPNEHVNSVPQRVLMYGCEYLRDGKLYRKSPNQDMKSLLRYMQAPNPGDWLSSETQRTTLKCLYSLTSPSNHRKNSPLSMEDYTGRSSGTI